MAYLNGSQIKELALKEIAKHAEGIGPTALLKIIQPRHPETKDGTIRGAVWKLDQDFPALIGKGPNGYYIKGNGKPAAAQKTSGPTKKQMAEKRSLEKQAKRAAPAKKPVAKGRDQSAEMAELRAKLEKTKKIVCG